MSNKTARANVEPVRQRTQYSCMAASMAMCLRANDHKVTEDEVNAVMGARPMKGAAWEQALATAQHYGCRATLTMPATVEQLKAWTDQGVPIMIAWNPEGRPWSHASVVFDVDDDLNVYVADPNIPNPKETVRVVSENDFYGKWYEKFPDYLVRRPACAIDREVTVDGKQKMASKAASSVTQIHLYDFDATLFKSPRKPDWWQGPWWSNPDSLSEPCVPKPPSLDWWVGKVLASARRSISDPSVYTAICTGRNVKVKPRLKEILRSGGLSFDELFLKPGGDTVLSGLLKRFPGAEIHFWEDRHDHLRSFMQHIKSQGGIGVPHPVPELYGQVLCTPEQMAKANDREVSHEARAKRKKKPRSMKTEMKGPKKTPTKHRNPDAKARAENTGGGGGGAHKNRDRGLAKGWNRKRKHKNQQIEASIDRLARGFLQMASSSFWKPHSGKIQGWKHVDEEIIAHLTWEDTYDTVKDRNVPDLYEVADPEMLADGIPELMESYSNAARDHAKWVRQGWWPRRVKVPNGGLHLMILSRPRSKAFEARFPKKDMRKALAMGEQAVEVIRGSKYPRWMKPIKLGAYSGNPDGEPIYDVQVDHGEHQPLSGGHDIMKRLQDRYRIEQGHPPRDGNPQLTNGTATQKVAWDWKADGIPPRDSRLVGTRPGKVLQQWGEHHSGAPFAIIPRDTRGMRGPQDKYHKVVIQNGVITHDFGSVPQLVRQARSSSNTPARVGRAVNQLALRFVAAQVEALR